jgi:hypothetical protein
MRIAFLIATAWALLAAAVPAAAQPASRVALVATAGIFHPNQSLRSVPRDGGLVYSGLGSTAMLSLGVEVRTPIRGTALRVSGSLARPELQVGAFPEERTTTRTTLVAAGLDAVVHGPRLGPARPYLLLGAWVRQYDFDQDGLTDGAGEAYAEDETRRAGRAGLGIRWDVGRWAVLGEAGGWFGPFDADGPENRVSQQDLHLSLGVRIPLR